MLTPKSPLNTAGSDSSRAKRSSRVWLNVTSIQFGGDWWTHPVVFRDQCWLYSQELLLAGLDEPYGMLESKPRPATC